MALPDIGLNDWLTYQQDRFKEATDGLLPALGFELDAKQAEATIPPDYNAPGGMDQWKQAEQQQIEEESRLAQDRYERQRQLEIEQQAEQYRQQQALAEQQRQQEEQAKNDAVNSQIQSLGIPTPDTAFAQFESPSQDNTSSAALLPSPTAVPTPVPTSPSSLPYDSREVDAGPHELSPADQFSAHANGLIQDTFGAPADQPPPDHGSSTGLLDQLGSAASAVDQGIRSSVQAVGDTSNAVEQSPVYQTAVRGGAPDVLGTARRGIESSNSIINTYGAGKDITDLNRMEEIRQQAAAESGDTSPRASLTLSPEWAQTHPELADEYQRLQDERTMAIGGMTGVVGGGGGVARDAIDAIKALRAAGMEEAAVNAEKDLAMKSPMTLDDIIKETRGASPEGAPEYREPLTTEEQAMNAQQEQQAAARGSHGGYLAEDVGNPEMATSATPSEEEASQIIRHAAPEDLTTGSLSADAAKIDPETGTSQAHPATKGLDPESPQAQVSLEQGQLPGFENVPEAPRPRESIRGFGAIPENLPPEAESQIRTHADALNAEQKPFTAEERVAAASKMIDADPQAVKPILEQALVTDPHMAGTQQELLKQNVRNVGDAWDQARQRVARVRADIAEHVAANPGSTAESAPKDMQDEAAQAMTHFQSLTNELQAAVKGQSLSAKAASQQLNAQKGGRLGAVILNEANRISDLGGSLARAAKAVQKVARTGKVDQETEGALQDVLTKLNNKRTRRAVEGGTGTQEDLDALQQAGVSRTRKPKAEGPPSDQEIKRRVDGAVGQEQNKQIREEIRTMAQEARTWIDRIRKFPDHQATLQENLDEIFNRMEAHSPTGKKVADDLRERLGVNLQEDLFRRTASEERRAADAVRANHYQEIRDKIAEIKRIPQAPGRAQKIADLYTELNLLSEHAGNKALSLRQQATANKIIKSGAFAQEADSSKLAQMLLEANPNDPNSLKPIMAAMSDPSLWAMWRELSFINMLSNPWTHIQNITSTGLNGMMRLLFLNPAEFIGSGGRTTGTGAAFKGFAGSQREAWSAGKQAFTTGISPKRLEGAIASGDMSHVGRELLPEALGKAGAIPRALGTAYHMMSTRPLEAMDAVMGHMMYESALAREIDIRANNMIRNNQVQDYMLDAASTLGKKDQVANYIRANIWDHLDLMKNAGKIEDYTLFRGKGSSGFEQGLRRMMGEKNLGEGAQWYDKVRGALVDFIMPFYNVPMNFTKQGVGLTPVGSLYHGIEAVRGLKAGDSRAVGEHLAKAAQGAAVMTLGGILLGGDNLTSTGPTDGGDRRTWLEDHKINSFRIPGLTNWISYEGTPFAIPFSSLAGAAENLRFNQKTDPNMDATGQVISVGAGALQGGIKGALSQSLVQAAQRNFETLTGQGAGPNALSQAAAGNVSRYFSPLPAGMISFLASVTDTMDRDPGRAQSLNLEDLKGAAERQLMTRIPGLRETLPVRLGAYGEELPNERSLVVSRGASIYPGYRGAAPHEYDPITQQLEKGSVGIPDAPNELTVGQGRKLPLTIAEQRRFQQVYGQSYRALLEQRGAGQREMTDLQMEHYRTMAREHTQKVLEREIGIDEMRRRSARPEPVKVAP